MSEDQEEDLWAEVWSVVEQLGDESGEAGAWKMPNMCILIPVCF